jgi:glycerol-3-phosphate responsive antiterminator
MENRTFVRNTDYPFPKNLTKNDEKKDALQDASITTIYTFDKDVAQIENAISKVSKSKKTVVLKQSIWNALQNKNAMNNKITLTP